MTITDKQVEAACSRLWPAPFISASEHDKSLAMAAMRDALEAAEAERMCATHHDITADIVRSCAASGIEVDSLDVLMAVERALPVAAPSSAEQPAADAPLRAWLGRRLAIEDAAEASGDSMDCTINTPSVMPSCLCCGRGGVAKCWAADHPEIYVCEQCHAKVTATAAPGAPEADERDQFAIDMRAFRPLLGASEFQRSLDGTFQRNDLQCAFLGWQARAQSSAAPSVAPAGFRVSRGGQWLFASTAYCAETVQAHRAVGATVELLYTAPPADARDGDGVVWLIETDCLPYACGQPMWLSAGSGAFRWVPGAHDATPFASKSDAETMLAVAARVDSHSSGYHRAFVSAHQFIDRAMGGE